MKRKVIKQGHNTLTITLPAKWASRNGIKAGDELEMQEKNGSLIMSAHAKPEVRAIDLDVGDVDLTLLKRYLNTAYKIGYDEISIRFDNPRTIENVQDTLQKNLIGFEIIKQGKNVCVIKSLSMVIDSEFDNTLRRVFLLLLSLCDESLNALKSKDVQYLKSATLLEESNNRFTTYCRRILNKNGYKEQDKVAFIYYIIEELEKMADELKYIFMFINENPKDIDQVDRDVLDLFEDVNDIVREYYELFYTPSRERVSSIHNKKKAVTKKGHRLLTEKDSINAVIVHHLLTVAQGIYDILPHQIALTLH